MPTAKELDRNPVYGVSLPARPTRKPEEEKPQVKEDEDARNLFLGASRRPGASA